MKRIVLSDDGHKLTRIHVSDEELVTEEVTSPQYMQALLDENARDRAGGVRKDRDMGWHVGRVDEVTHYNWMREWREHYKGSMTKGQFIAMKLNDRDNSQFRLGVKRV